MTILNTNKLIATKRIVAALETANLSETSAQVDMDAVIAAFKWAAAGNTWDALHPYSEGIIKALITLDAINLIYTLPPEGREILTAELRTLNEKDLYLETGTGGILPLTQLLRLHLSSTYNLSFTEVILSTFDRIQITALLLINQDNLLNEVVANPIISKHLTHVAELLGETTTKLEAANDGTDDEQDDFITHYDEVLPYFISYYLDGRDIYNLYIEDGVTTSPVDGTDYTRIAIEAIDASLIEIYQ